MSRREAHQRGEKFYYSGRPCSKGHQAPRYGNSGACVQCIRGYAEKYRKDPLLAESRPLWVSINLLDIKDEKALRDYAEALNFERKLTMLT